MKIGFFEKVNKTTKDPENSMGRLVVFMITITGITLMLGGLVAVFMGINPIPLLSAGEGLLVTGVLGKAKQTKNENGEK